MAYSAPTLLLVGAAQNLVLGAGSPITVGKRDCLQDVERDDFNAFYDETGLW